LGPATVVVVIAGLNRSEFKVAADESLPAGFTRAEAAFIKQTIAAKKSKTTLLLLLTAVRRFPDRGLIGFIKHFLGLGHSFSLLKGRGVFKSFRFSRALRHGYFSSIGTDNNVALK